MQLGDRGDGSAQSKEEARRRWMHLNSGHVPDIIVQSVPPTLYEFKCYTWAVRHPKHGGGSTTGGAYSGGKPSTAEGHIYAFGGTEEDLRRNSLGAAARGDPSTAYDRATGTGYVAAHDGAYADALGKGLRVHLCVTETSGAINVVLSSLLHLLARTAAAQGATDNTRYGTGRAATRSYYAHHLAEISTAVQVADAVVIGNAAAHMGFKLSHGVLF